MLAEEVPTDMEEDPQAQVVPEADPSDSNPSDSSHGSDDYDSSDPGSGSDINERVESDSASYDSNAMMSDGSEDEGESFEDASSTGDGEGVESLSDGEGEGEDPDDEGEASDGDEGEAAADGAAAKQRVHEAKGPNPLYADSPFTVIMAVYALVKHKLETNMTTESFEGMLKMFSIFLPQDNELPTSYHVCKTILNVRKLEEFWLDSCPCNKWSYERAAPGKKKADDKCPYCHLNRYKPDDGSGNLFVPVQVWIKTSFPKKKCLIILKTDSEVALGKASSEA